MPSVLVTSTCVLHRVIAPRHVRRVTLTFFAVNTRHEAQPGRRPVSAHLHAEPGAGVVHRYSGAFFFRTMIFKVCCTVPAELLAVRTTE